MSRAESSTRYCHHGIKEPIISIIARIIPIPPTLFFFRNEIIPKYRLSSPIQTETILKVLAIVKIYEFNSEMFFDNSFDAWYCLDKSILNQYTKYIPIIAITIDKIPFCMVVYYLLPETPALSKLAILFKNATADSIIGYATAIPVPSPRRMPRLISGFLPRKSCIL